MNEVRRFGIHVRRGFTLVELLVVMGIVALLASLLISSSKGALNGSRSAKCMGNLRQIYAASQNWSSDNGEMIVPCFTIVDPNNAGSLRNWTGLLAPYLECNRTNDFAASQDLPVAACPAHPSNFGYGYNVQYLGWPQLSGTQAPRQINIPHPAQTVFIADSQYGDGTDTSFGKWRSYVRPPSLSFLKDHVVRFDHPGNTAHVLWLDGHISSEVTNSAFWKDDQLWDRN